MKFSTTTGVVALGLAGNAVADWGTTTTTTTTSTTTKSTTTPAWTCPASTVTSTKTETVTAWKDTTTVYRSTVFVGPGPATTVYPSTCPNVGPTGSAPGGGWGPGSSSAAGGAASSAKGSWAPGSSAPAGPATSKSAAGGAWDTTRTITKTASPVPAGPSGSWGPGGSWVPGPSGSSGNAAPAPSSWAAGGDGGNWGNGGNGGNGDGSWGSSLDPGMTGTVVASNGDAYTWTSQSVADPSSTAAAPTYSGWNDWTGPTGGGADGSGPAPGTDKSNVTEPQPPIKGDASCNTAADRSKWCGGKSIDTDWYKDDYSTGKICSYDFTITNTTYNPDGLVRQAFAINGQVPGPLIECNWGDIISVKVTNKLQDNSTTIHWHGIVQKHSNDQDGVPGVSECAIAPGQSRTYKFKASQYGTGWYHSHVLAQLGDGLRGPMVIHGPATANYDLDMGTVMIDEVFGTNTTSVSAGTQNARISRTGPTGTFNYLLNGNNVSPDLTKGKHTTWTVQPGKKHLFRFINSGAQNMWSVHFDNHKMTVIAADYVPIVPYTTEWLNIALGQRYDVIVEMDQPVGGYFLRAVTQRGCPSSCVNTGLGQANGIIYYEGANLVLPTSTAGNKTLADFAICKDEPIASLVPHLKKSAGSASAFAATASLMPAGNVAQVATARDGTVFRWFLNNGAINVNFTQPTLKSLVEGQALNSTSFSNAVTINVKNQWVYFIIQNQFFASHPIHLHGHDLSLLGQGTTTWTPSLVSTLNFDNPPRRDTAILAGSRGPGFPAGHTVIGFETDNPGAWLMHCHIIWHVDGGLALQFIERPDDIIKYGDKVDFDDECKSQSAYEAAGGGGHGARHGEGSSGLKARTYFDDLIAARSEDVVRRSDSAERHYIDSYVKRGLGDGYKPRHRR